MARTTRNTVGAPGAQPQATRRSARLQEAAAGPLKDNTNRVAKPQPKPKVKAPRFDCSVCDRSLVASNFAKILPSDNCKHKANTCKPCMKSWITAQLESTTYDKIACPECLETMTNASIKVHASKETYEKFDQLERRGIQDKVPGWRWCLAPKCREGKVHIPVAEVSANTTSGKGRKGKKVKEAAEDVCVCDSCGAKACVPCDRPYHDGESCAQFSARVKRQNVDEEQATAKQIEASCKKCPGCKTNIEKNGGCDQVYCYKCKTSFCWLCSTTYAVINTTGHDKGCMYARPDRFDPHAAVHAPANDLNANAGMFGQIAANLAGIFPG